MNTHSHHTDHHAHDDRVPTGTPRPVATAPRGDHVEHVTPGYVDTREPDVAHAPLGHALDPHPELSADRPATADHAAMGHGPAGVVTDHAAMDHAAMGHGGMAHDMGDPAMAAAMERDIRNRFFVALALTIPTVIYSSLGHRLLGVELPAPLPAN